MERQKLFAYSINHVEARYPFAQGSKAAASLAIFQTFSHERAGHLPPSFVELKACMAIIDPPRDLRK
jgi:hypothetical protein